MGCAASGAGDRTTPGAGWCAATSAIAAGPAMKALAVLLYGMGGMSFSMIGRVLGVSDVAVLKWVRAEAAALPEPKVPVAAVTVEIDEMWHFIKNVWPAPSASVFRDPV